MSVKINIPKIVAYIALCILLFFILAYLLTYNSTHINVDLCLQKDAFKKYDDRIEETLEYNGVEVIDKGISSHVFKGKGHKKYLTVCIKEENNAKVNVYVDDFTYNIISVGDEIDFSRVVYYTLSGLRLNYKDYVYLRSNYG